MLVQLFEFSSSYIAFGASEKENAKAKNVEGARKPRIDEIAQAAARDAIDGARWNLTCLNLGNEYTETKFCGAGIFFPC